MNLIDLRQDFETRRRKYYDAPLLTTETERKRMMTSVRLSLAQIIPDDDTRRRVVGRLWGKDTPMSTTELTPGQLFVMKRWLQPLPVGTTWTVNRAAQEEIQAILAHLALPVLVQEAIENGGELTQAGIAFQEEPTEPEPVKPEPDDYFVF